MNFNMLKTIKASISHSINLVRNKFRDVGVSTKRSSKWPTVEKYFRESHSVCAVCGTAEKLNVHHKQPFHLHPELELDVNNLITLCMGPRECHLIIGHGNDFKSYNPNIDADVAILTKDITKFASIAEKAKENKKFN